MITARNSRTLLILPLLLLALALLGCATKPKVWGDPETGLVLTYRMQADQPLKYRTTMNQSHRMQARGQSRQFQIAKSLEFSMEAEASGEDAQQLSITVDSMSLEIDAPRGKVERELTELHGKSFGMALSALGNESDFTGLEEVKYEMQPAGPSNVAAEFDNFFPDLAGRAVRVGDSWPSERPIRDTAFNSAQNIMLKSVHTLDGLETVDGMKCAKISTSMIGELEPRGDTQIRAPEMTGRFDGTGVWYFAYEEGLLVKSKMTLRGTGEMLSGEVGGMARPMGQQMTIETQLLQ